MSFDNQELVKEIDEDIPEFENSSEESEDDVEKWELVWNIFEKACKQRGSNPMAVFATHIGDINDAISSDLYTLTSRLSVKEVLMLTELVNTTPVSTDDKKSTVSDQKDGQPSESDAIINLQKGLNNAGINQFIVQIDNKLKNKDFKDVIVITNDWKNSPEPFPMINAAKKLFAKYSESGLLGCLISRGYEDAARKVYCVAYVKGKIMNGDVTFSGIDPKDYMEKVKRSVEMYNTLIK